MASVLPKNHAHLLGPSVPSRPEKHVEAADMSAHTIRGKSVLHPITEKQPRQLENRKKTRGRNKTCTLAGTLAVCRALEIRKHVEAAVVTASQSSLAEETSARLLMFPVSRN